MKEDIDKLLQKIRMRNNLLTIFLIIQLGSLVYLGYQHYTKVPKITPQDNINKVQVSYYLIAEPLYINMARHWAALNTPDFKDHYGMISEEATDYITNPEDFKRFVLTLNDNTKWQVLRAGYSVKMLELLLYNNNLKVPENVFEQIKKQHYEKISGNRS